MYHQNITVSYENAPLFPAFMPLFNRQPRPPQRPRMKSIISYAAKIFDVSVADIEGKSRVQHLSRCRHLIVYCTRKLRPDMSYPQIGAVMGGRDHSTSINSMKQATALRLHVPEFDDQCRELLSYFRGDVR